MKKFLHNLNNKSNNFSGVSLACEQRVAERNKKTVKFLVVSFIICALAFTACFFAYQINSTNTYNYKFNGIAVNQNSNSGLSGSVSGTTNNGGSESTVSNEITLTIKAIWGGSTKAMNLEEAHAAASGNMNITLRTHNVIGNVKYEESFGTSVTINAEEWKKKSNAQVECVLYNVPVGGVFYCEAFSEYEDKGKMIIWRAEFIPTDKYFGFNGQIIEINEEYIDILCKGGKLRVTEYELSDDFKMLVGHKLK